MAHPIVTTRLRCGADLVVEPMESVASVAIAWLLPGGSATDPPDGDGHAALLSEMIFRGAAGLNSREHSDLLDRLGVDRSSEVYTSHFAIEAVLLGSRLDEALPWIAGVVTDPALPEDAVEPVRSLCLQSIESLDDDPQQLAMLRLRERHLPPPFNRHGYGRTDVIERATGDALRRGWAERSKPGGSIIAVAGAVDGARLASNLDRLLEGYSGRAREPVALGAPTRGYLHIPQETSQVHIGLAYDAPAERDPNAMLERLGIAVLSGSTSARLFTEVRAKRSLCYSVGASYRPDRDRGFVALYAGTTPQRAQETLDVCAGEIERLREGATREEFDRAVIGLKSRLIMQGESTAARSGVLAREHYRLGRVRTLDELAAAIDAITLDDLDAYLARREPGLWTIVSIGPEPLRVPESSAVGQAPL